MATGLRYTEKRIPRIPINEDPPSREELKRWLPDNMDVSGIASELQGLWKMHRSSAVDLWHASVRRFPELFKHPDFVENWFSRVLGSRWKWEEWGPPPVWLPDQYPRSLSRTRPVQLMDLLGFGTWEELHRFSVRNRLAFWETITFRWFQIPFLQPPEKVAEIQDVREPRWFPGARMNIVQACFHSAFHSHGMQEKALIVETADGDTHEWTYRELLDRIQHIAQHFQDTGISPGTPVGLCMPMHGEAVMIYLALIWVGAVVVSVAESLASPEVFRRLQIAGARLLITQDVVLRKGKELVLYERLSDYAEQHHLSVQFLVYRRMRGPLRGDARDASFLFSPHRSPQKDPYPADPMDPIHVLFSSGTTGDPKAIPWNHTTPLKCAMDGSLLHDIQEDDICTWPTSLGWMMGPWLLFASFINGATVALYEEAPTRPEFLDFIRKRGVTMLGLVPTLVRAWRQNPQLKEIQLPSIRIFSSTGEASDFPDYLWLFTRVPGTRPVIEYCGGTEIGGGYISGTVVHPASPTAFTTPAPGLDFVILDDQHRPVEPPREGELFLIPPSVGLSVTLLNREHHAEYFTAPEVPGSARWKGVSGVLLEEQQQGWDIRLRRHGDQMQYLPQGYFRALGRADDTMNLGGIKVSSVEIERVVNQVEGVQESAAIGVPLSGRGGPESLVIYVVLQPSHPPIHVLKSAIQKAIRDQLNPLFHVHDVVPVPELPRTPTNKIMRRILRKQYLESHFSR